MDVIRWRRYLRNGDGEVTETIDPAVGSFDKTEKDFYDGAGNVTETQDAYGNTTYDEYTDGRLTVTIDATGHASTSLYDGNGNVTETIDANGNATEYEYDGDGRVTATVEVMSGGSSVITQQTFYDAAGNVTGTTDGLGNLTQYLLDADERQTVTIDAMLNRTTQMLDNDGSETVTIDASGNHTTMSYDGAGRLTVTTTPLGVTTMMYDSDGMVTGTIYAPTAGVSKSTSYAYNGAEQLTTETWYQGGSVTNIASYLYDAEGRLTVAANSAGAYTMSYNNAGQVSAVQEPFSLALTFTYDDDGNRTVVQDSQGGVTTSLYDGNDRLTSVQLTAGSNQNNTQMREDLTYQSNDLLSTLTRYEAVAGLATEMVGTTSFQYDANDRVTAILDYKGSTQLAGYTYAYDKGDQLTSETDNGKTVAYGYNTNSELTSSGGNNYNYNATGARDTSGYTDGTDNEITNDGTWSFSYDSQGNVIGKSDGSGDLWTYTYDNRNHMTSAQESTSGTPVVQATFTYDVFGNMLTNQETVNGVTTSTSYGYDGWNPAKGGATGNSGFDVWATLNSSGSIINRYVNGDQVDQVFGQVAGSAAGGGVSNGSVAWYLTDHLNSVVGETSANGTLLATMAYDAYGNSEGTTNVSGSPAPVVQVWSGMRYDAATGLYAAGNGTRFYNAPDGDFQSQDPMGLAAGDSNLYRYVNDAPTNATDPSGLAEDDRPWYQRAWNSTTNFARSAYNEVTMVTSYVVSNPLEAAREARTGANQGAAIMINQATLGTAYQAEARQAEAELGATTTAIVRLCGSTAEVCLVAVAAPAAGVSSGYVLTGAGFGAGANTLIQVAQIVDGTRTTFDVGEVGRGAQIGALAPMVANAIGPTATAELVAAGTGFGLAKALKDCSENRPTEGLVSGGLALLAFKLAPASPQGAGNAPGRVFTQPSQLPAGSTLRLRAGVIEVVDAEGAVIGRIPQIAGGAPRMTQWGWEGSNSWRTAVREVGSGGEGGVLRTVRGHVPTYEEAVQLIQEAGGTVVRVEGPHAAGGVAGL